MMQTINKTKMYGYLVEVDICEEGYSRCDIYSNADYDSYVNLHEIEDCPLTDYVIYDNGEGLTLTGKQISNIKNWAYSNGY
jgi:uncharacterized Fe-S cluster-containing protein